MGVLRRGEDDDGLAGRRVDEAEVSDGGAEEGGEGRGCWCGDELGEVGQRGSVE